MKIVEEQLTPMMKQYYEIKKNYQDYILFYRLGDFYEMFFDDAKLAARELEITLTSRNCGMKERAPLAGIPKKSMNEYLSKLIEKNYKVAICEQVEDPADAKGIVKREVVKIVTPGTITEPSMLKEKSHNYILSFYKDDDGVGVAFADITTGEVKVTSFEGVKHINACLDEILKIDPSEIVFLDNSMNQEIMAQVEQYIQPVASEFNETYYKVGTCEKTIKRVYDVYSLDSYGLSEKTYETIALGALLQYIEETQKVALLNFDDLEIYSQKNYMFLDKFSRRNLELSETIRTKEKKGSLLWVLDQTSTAMGGRRLKKWIEEPLLNKELIEKRLNAVEYFNQNLLIKEEIKELLKKIYDLERLVSKLVYGSVNARDLISLKHSLFVLPELKLLLESADAENLIKINEEIDLLKDIHELIDNSIVENPPTTLTEGGIIKPAYDEELYELVDIMTNGKDWILSKEVEEKKNTGISTLKIGSNKVFGYYIEVTKKNTDLVPEHYIRKQTLSNSERYITPELKEIESKIFNAEEKSVKLEYKLFVEVKNQILDEINRIKQTAKAISKLDVLISFADISVKNNYVKPEICEDHTIDIKEARHPVIEQISLEEEFVPNDIVLDSEQNKFLIITGPNMAGKSTYLRQTALIVLMAQVGCFVPADAARIGLVDRIFTRVGASDDLSQGQSTFMVEMSELANILHNATDRSLIILDEIGRGTSTYDGLSIAWSVVEYLSDSSQLNSKTMFATHYHELTELEGKFDGVKNFYITAQEDGDDIVFLRKIKRGEASQSYGIQVAKLAGVPQSVINRAKEILTKLEETDINNNIDNLTRALGTNQQLSFIEEKESNKIADQLEYAEVIEKIKSIDLLNLTPLEAMNHLHELINKAKNL